MSKNRGAILVARYNLPDEFYPASVGHAARTFISKAPAAYPTVRISLHPGETK